ncbi:DUF924 domain-containing protein [Roseospira marina]|uniref:DUF924 domain-containing protein n=1 Tax=Roseospira marina TaxID=140057 RepID=A0A5M6IDL8_9PROT|nr:DUF924 family protein [Roseospira marina]KAA5605825.1 DUF924 domain-containing protein [Roseospira marina]MBB4313643.1 uncharacterized protein (DUF924 family) [Roseospira marina]MBB5086805.1 uncharacterized protein (DUF924 family) [Roseospira marina]
MSVSTPSSEATAPLPPDARALLDFWFGAPGTPEHGTFRDLWFARSDAFDAQLRDRFGALYARAKAGDLNGWAATPHGALALILLLDQVPRNIHRGTPAAFATDAQALDVAKQALRDGHDQALAPMERLFLYMPFQHSEDGVEQERSLALYERLGIEDAQKSADRHHEIVARFGRFPHRNAVLGRETTEEERAFLQEPNSSF